VRDRARDLARRSKITFDDSHIDSTATGSVLLLAYPDRLAVRRQPGQFQLRSGSAAWCAPRDVLGPEHFIVAADLDGDRKNARIRLAAAVEESTILQVLHHHLIEERVVLWDRERQDFIERVTRRIEGMRLSEITKRPDPSEETSAVILDYLKQSRLSHLPWTSISQQLRSRVNFLQRELGEPWPLWSDKELVNTASEWLAPFLIGMTSIEEVRSLDMNVLLRSMLPWPVGSQLDELAPTHFVAPSQKTIAIDYDHALQEGTAPIVRIRVQDLFGLATHPTILGGRIPLVLHLLSPADRPIQITADLPTFWQGSWSEVRKDMAGRYPKHQWPQDPASAQPKRLKDR
jgi:ATP-dependent helicase HrpB